MKPHILETKTIIHRPLSEVFSFFSKAENLNELTPPELHFKILTPMPIEMKQGIYIDYRIKLNGIPFSWKTLISTWEPPHRFVDEQIKGPYMRWHHTHSFKSVDENTTEMTDRIEYLSPGWILEPLINRLFVQKKVEAIFAYREHKLLEIFAR
ncbi:MAG: SRPBCC family protein [Bacteroidota bacterium]|jgi:ligand-binding SRPBCC domain-containing protein